MPKITVTTADPEVNNIAWDADDAEDRDRLQRHHRHVLMRRRRLTDVQQSDTTGTTETAAGIAKKPRTKSQLIQREKTALDKGKADMKYAQQRQTQGEHFKQKSGLNPTNIQKRIKMHQERLKKIQQQKATTMEIQIPDAEVLDMEIAAELMDPLAALQNSAKTGKPTRAVFADGQNLLLSPYVAIEVLKMLDQVTQSTYEKVIDFISARKSNYIKIQKRALWTPEELQGDDDEATE